MNQPQTTAMTTATPMPPSQPASFATAMGLNRPRQAGMITAGAARQMAEVQAALVMAKTYPRSEAEAIARLRQACTRPKLADLATYAFPRGDTTVEGPSIRLAEAAAQAWGNLDHGWREIDRRTDPDRGCGISTVEAYAWDLETNARKTLTFEVRHWRDTKRGGYALTDERDVYEVTANQAARRIRACILSIIPGDIVDDALDVCRQTLERADGGKPMVDRVRDMLIAFSQYRISQRQIEDRLRKKADAMTPAELRDLRSIWTSLRDGMGKPADYFRPEAELDANSGETDDQLDMTPPKAAAPAAPAKAEAPPTKIPARSFADSAPPPRQTPPPAATPEQKADQGPDQADPVPFQPPTEEAPPEAPAQQPADEADERNALLKQIDALNRQANLMVDPFKRAAHSLGFIPSPTTSLARLGGPKLKQIIQRHQAIAAEAARLGRSDESTAADDLPWS